MGRIGSYAMSLVIKGVSNEMLSLWLPETLQMKHCSLMMLQSTQCCLQVHLSTIRAFRNSMRTGVIVPSLHLLQITMDSMVL